MEALIEATTWGVFVPFALSVGYLGGIGTANLLHRTDRRRPRYLTRYVAHVEQQLARHRIPDLPPISTIPRPAFDNSRCPVPVLCAMFTDRDKTDCLPFLFCIALGT
jgi:hypothetical protein